MPNLTPTTRRCTALPWARSRLLPWVLAALLGACGDGKEAYVASGKAFLEKRDDAAAIIQFKNAVAQDGDDGEARFYLATALQRSGDLPAAEIEYRKAISLGIDRARAVPALATILNDMGKPAQALEEVKSVTGGDLPAQAALAAIEGDALLLQGNTDDARAAYQRALSADPRSAGGLVGMARLTFADGDAEAALRGMAHVVNLHPDNADAWLLNAALLMRLGKAQEAAQAYDRVIALRPADLRAYTGVVPALLATKQLDAASERVATMEKFAGGSVGARYLVAILAYAKGEKAKARDAILQVLKASPDDARALLLAGSVEHDLGNHASAEKFLSRVVMAAPKEARPRQLLATTYLRMGQPEKARDTIAGLMAEPSPDARTLEVMGQIATALKDPRAPEYLERAAKLEPGDTGLRARLGLARLAGGKPEEGVSELQAMAAAEGSGPVPGVALVEYFLSTKQVPRARTAADELVRKLPQEAGAQNALGGVLLAQKDAAGARAAFEKAVQLSPAFYAATRNLVSMDLAEGKPEPAIARLRTVTDKDPSNRDAAVTLAALLHRTHAPAAEVIAVLDKSIAANPTAIEPRLAKTDFLLSLGDAKSALEVARATHSTAGDDPKVLFALARAQFSSGDYSQAGASYGKLVSLSPKSVVGHAGQAEAYASEKNWTGARRSLERVIALQPEHVHSRIALVEVGIKAETFDVARRDAQDIQKRWPKLPAGFIAEAQVLAAAKELPGAEKVLREAQARLDQPELQNRLTAVLMLQQREADAEKEATQWTAAHPKDAKVATFIADAYLGRSRYQEAERWYQRAVQIRKEDPMVLNNLAWVMGKLENPAAVETAQRALAMAPNNPVVLDTVGALQVQFGQAEAGVANLRRAAASLPRSASIRVNLARGLIKSGKKDDAKAVLDEAGRLQPSETLRKEIDELAKTL